MDGRRGQSMLAVPFIYLYLRIFGSIQQFVCFDVLTVFKQAELQADKYQPLFLRTTFILESRTKNDF